MKTIGSFRSTRLNFTARVAKQLRKLQSKVSGFLDPATCHLKRSIATLPDIRAGCDGFASLFPTPGHAVESDYTGTRVTKKLDKMLDDPMVVAVLDFAAVGQQSTFA